MQQVPRQIAGERRPVERQQQKGTNLSFDPPTEKAGGCCSQWGGWTHIWMGSSLALASVQHSSFSMGWEMAAALGDREQHPPSISRLAVARVGPLGL